MKTLEELIAERDKLLEENPHLKPFQDKIDEIMGKTPDDMKLEVLNIMMVCKLKKLAVQFKKLKEFIPDADSKN